jgi:potassium-transporting ATPase potassium-binding subunit
MTANDWLQFLIVVVALAATAPFLGHYMARVFSNGRSPGDRFFTPVERGIYRLSGVDPEREQRWRTYAMSLLTFSLVSVTLLYLLERLQGHLPFNPSHVPGVPAALAWNTAVSFVTNTNWQNYSGESTMSILTQMTGLTVQNFLSAAAGIVIAIALVRGLTRGRSATIGNFWVDLTRTVTRILLPLSILAAVVLVASGVIQNFGANHVIHTLSGGHQTLPSGAIASQEAIKELGTNGGGPFSANSAHPFENPNGFTNLFEIWLLLVIPFALPFTFGKMAGRVRQGVAVLSAMVILWIGSGVATMLLESAGSHAVPQGISQRASATTVGGNLTGKELRFGAAPSALFNSSATGTSTGAVDSMGDSYTALGGGVLLFNMMLGEVSPGGTGSGLYGMLVLAILSVFIAGLMVGRTPEYLGKKIQATEMKLVALYVLIVPFAVLGFAALSIMLSSGRASIANPGAHGLTEMIYAFTSASNNNGSAFAGFNGATTYFNTTLGFCMLIGRFAIMIPVLAIAGSLGRKQTVPDSAGTLPTDTPLFATLLTGVTVIIVGLTYFPVLALGPLVEHFVSHV